MGRERWQRSYIWNTPVYEINKRTRDLKLYYRPWIILGLNNLFETYLPTSIKFELVWEVRFDTKSSFARPLPTDIFGDTVT